MTRAIKVAWSCSFFKVDNMDHVLEIITKLAYSKSVAEYDLHYQDLLESGLFCITTQIGTVFVKNG